MLMTKKNTWDFHTLHRGNGNSHSHQQRCKNIHTFDRYSISGGCVHLKPLISVLVIIWGISEGVKYSRGTQVPEKRRVQADGSCNFQIQIKSLLIHQYLPSISTSKTYILMRTRWCNCCTSLAENKLFLSKAKAVFFLLIILSYYLRTVTVSSLSQRLLAEAKIRPKNPAIRSLESVCDLRQSSPLRSAASLPR